MNYQSYKLITSISGLILLSSCAVMPVPISEKEQKETIAADKKIIFANQEKITKPLTLYEAMARALKHNLEHRVKIMEEAVADGQSDLTNLTMLPDLVASAGYRSRDNFSASSSRAIGTGGQSVGTSTSQDRTRYTADLIFSWNILDFGVSYFQARQDANKVLIAEESRRKTAQLLMQEVRTAFWRTASTQQVQGSINTVLKNARNALNDARQIEKEKLLPPLEILTYQKNLLEIIRDLENLVKTLELAKIELASLLGLKPGQNFTLAVPKENLTKLPRLDLNIQKMEELSLQLRPELREEIYNNRITAEETYKSILRLLPGIEFNLAYNYDSNSYSLNKDWLNWTGLISQNVMELLSAPAVFSHIDAQEALDELRRLSVYMAVLTQVHLSYSQYLLSEHQFKRIEELDHVNQKLEGHMAKLSKNSARSKLEFINVASDALMSRLQLHEAYAEMQSALGRVFTSIGLDSLPTEIENHDIETLAQSIEHLDHNWQMGKFISKQIISGPP
ncbi:MAG: TolC family protein [Gammaproteobacteria bacterium]